MTIPSMSNPVGRPECHVAAAWALRFDLSQKQKRLLRSNVCWQLAQCKDDAARRILLGKSQ